MPVPGTQADDNRHAAFHLALNKKYYQMKRTLHVLSCCLFFLAVESGMTRLVAQTAIADTLEWSWEVTSTTSTKNKTCILAFVDGLQINWGDGTVEWIGDSLSSETLTHQYATAGDYTCTVVGNTISYFKADSRRLLTLDPLRAPNLTYISCTSSQLTVLDLSDNPKLETLYCGGNDLTMLNLSANILLETLTCSDNQLTQLDVSDLPLLKKVTCHTNPLTTIGVHSSGALSYLSCSACSLSAGGLDSLFNQLPTLAVASSSQNLIILNNPGTEDCHPDIAIAKNWTLEEIVTESSFYIPAVSSKIGDTALVEVWLNNIVPSVAFEIDLLLPDGLELDTLRTCLIQARRGNHVLSVAKTSDSTQLYKLIAYSLTSKDTLSGNDGAVLQLYITVPDTVSTYTLDLKKAVLVDTATNTLDLTLTDGKLSIIPVYTMGDADGDYLVNVTDIVWLVARINGRRPDGFQDDAMDIDENSVWNVADIVKVVEIINAASTSASISTDRTSSIFSFTDGYTVVLSAYNAETAIPGNHLYLKQDEADPTIIHLCLNNSDEVQALQTDIILSEGLALETESATLSSDRTTGYNMSLTCVSAIENRYRLLVWSLSIDNALFGSSDTLVCLHVVQATSADKQDSLSGYLEQALLTGMDMKTISCLTYATQLAFAQNEAVVQAVAGSDGNGNLWVKGSLLRKVVIFDPRGLKLAVNECPGENGFSTQIQPGIYIVVVEQETLPQSVFKVFVP